jgi:hypothetical protein
VIAALGASIDAALAARTRLRDRPIGVTATALAEAARRWCDDAGLAAGLPEIARLTAPMVHAVLPLVAEALDADALRELHAREAGPESPPSLVAAVLASNVPGLALPAIAHACLAGAAVVVKSGRADTLSAPAFHRALAAVDPELAATVVPAYWPGGATDVEAAVLPRADVVVAMGGDETVAALRRRLQTRLLADGNRSSFADIRGDAGDDEIHALAWDVVRYEQRGCLSPQAVFVLGHAGTVATRLTAALDTIARDVPAPEPSLEERAAHRLAVEAARFDGDTVLESAVGTVIVDANRRYIDGPGRRTVRVHALDDTRAVTTVFAPGTVECIGLGRGVQLDADVLRERGVARLCPVGRMQRPRIDWPRGQRPPLASLFRAGDEPRIQVES